MLSGKEVAAAVRAEVGERVAKLAGDGVSVGLATVMVGEDPASAVYVGNKHRAADKAGMVSFDHHLPSSASQAEVEDQIRRLNEDDRIDGMIVQLPLPDGLDGESAVETVAAAKDADGLHPYNLGLLVLGRSGPRPATPSGVMRILDYYDIDVAGKTAAIIGRSYLVGRPLALLLGEKGTDATVFQAHSRTPDLAAITSQADLLIVAVGRAHMVGPEYVKDGAVVIDVGINRTESGLAGDVDYAEVSKVAGAITPVPGGVGPMTIASLLENTVAAAERKANRH